MKRNKALEIINKHIDEEHLFIFANGRITREAYVARDGKGNFYMLSSMGKAASIGLGVALNAPSKNVIVVDGDGNALMNLDTFAMTGYLKPKNFTHIVLDDRAYATTGGQETVSSKVDLSDIARAGLYKHVSSAGTEKTLHDALKKREQSDGPHFILVRIESDMYPVSRISHHSPKKIRDRFMKAVTA